MGSLMTPPPSSSPLPQLRPVHDEHHKRQFPAKAAAIRALAETQARAPAEASISSNKAVKRVITEQIASSSESPAPKRPRPRPEAQQSIKREIEEAVITENTTKSRAKSSVPSLPQQTSQTGTHAPAINSVQARSGTTSKSVQALPKPASGPLVVASVAKLLPRQTSQTDTRAPAKAAQAKSGTTSKSVQALPKSASGLSVVASVARPFSQQTSQTGTHAPATNSAQARSGTTSRSVQALPKPASSPSVVASVAGPRNQARSSSMINLPIGWPAAWPPQWTSLSPTDQLGIILDMPFEHFKVHSQIWMAYYKPNWSDHEISQVFQSYRLSSQTGNGQTLTHDLGSGRSRPQSQSVPTCEMASSNLPYSGAHAKPAVNTRPHARGNSGHMPASTIPYCMGQPPQVQVTHSGGYYPYAWAEPQHRREILASQPPLQVWPATVSPPPRQPFVGSEPPAFSYLGWPNHATGQHWRVNELLPQAYVDQRLDSKPPSTSHKGAAKPVEPLIQDAGNPKLAPTDEPLLCPEQATLVNEILEGHNVFYTGSAGCGKSTVLRAFVRKLKEMGKNVQILAPTGRAALNVGGSTTWTFAGWRPDSHKKPLKQLKDDAFFGKQVKERLTGTDVLVIDEISMVENLHFERLSAIMQSARYKPGMKSSPFGGCQVIVTGDFCQLPPVKPFRHCIECGKELIEKTGPNNKIIYQCRHHGLYADEDKWAFRSKAWEACNFKHVHLKTIHRQDDEVFIRMLQKCRLGDQLTESEISLLLDHKARVSQATKLFCTRKEADDVNRAAFDKIKAEKHLYWAHDTFIQRQQDHAHLRWKGTPKEWRNVGQDQPPRDKRPLQALDEHRFSECVQLKRGGLVVLLANLDLSAGLCNGSQGVICGFEEYDPSMLPVREIREEMMLGTKLKRETKITPKPGQRILRGDYAGVQELEIKHFITSECVPIKKWPVVQFHNGLRRTVYGECSIAQLGDEQPYSLLARTQLPLAPAWAMTVHKSQSLTLDRVIVNLDRAFEEGQVYVALSRATGLSGLKIEGDGRFLRKKLMVNAEVAAFLKEKFGDIYEGQEAKSTEDVSVTEPLPSPPGADVVAT